MTSTIHDPRTGTAVADVRRDDAAAVDDAIRASAIAFRDWRTTTPSERATRLNRLASAIEGAAHLIAAAEASNTGRRIDAILEEEIPAAVDELRFMAGAARALQGPVGGEYTPGHHSRLTREPLGVCAQIVPWNFPFTMTVSKIAAPLAMGNTVVVKPAETTPLSAQILEELCERILPADVVRFVYGDRDTGRHLVAHPVPALVSITGSTRAGIEVAQAASATLKRLHLELGGKSAALVFADADLEAAAEGIADAALYNGGQDCTAASRVLVAADVVDRFTSLLRRRMIAAADPVPLNSREHLARVSGYVERLPSHARVVLGGRPQPGDGFFFEPTLVVDVRQDDEIVQEEVFGPVVTVQSFTSEQEAVALANGVAFGLAASLWTTGHPVATRVPPLLDAGTVWVNCHSVLSTEMPHGGFKASGYGKELSVHALEAYSRIKHTVHRAADGS